MGGGRLHSLLEKIVKLPTLQKYLDEKIERRGWKVAEGWIESPDSKPLKRIACLSGKQIRTENEEQELQKLEERYKADWITGHPFVETEDFTEDGIKQIHHCSKTYFLRRREKNKEIFQPPHLLIHESVQNGKISAILSTDYITFKDSIVGIHSPETDIGELQNIKNYLSDESNVALIWLNSGKVITMREGTPLMGDILSLPYPKIEFNTIEKVLLEDIAIHYSEFRKEGEKSNILDVASSQDLDAFGAMYCRILNSVYNGFKPVSPIIGNRFIAYPFILGEQPEMEIPTAIDEVEAKLQNLIDSKVGCNLWIKRIVKVYHKNVIFLYKPNQKRYWLRSTAIRDADDTFMDLYNQGK
jgi:hypothetical protein